MSVKLAVVTALGLMVTGCAGSKIAPQPVGISGRINGLQQSQCNCGGVETEKEFKKRRKAQAKAQAQANGSENR